MVNHLWFKCKECKCDFSITESRFRDKGKRVFCSKECRLAGMKGEKHLWWKDGRHKKQMHDGKIKPFYWVVALEHYEKCCNRCFVNKNLHVHHKDRNRKNNDYKNLEILCASCHAKEHKFIRNFGDKVRHGSPKSLK